VSLYFHVHTGRLYQPPCFQNLVKPHDRVSKHKLVAQRRGTARR